MMNDARRLPQKEIAVRVAIGKKLYVKTKKYRGIRRQKKSSIEQL